MSERLQKKHCQTTVLNSSLIKAQYKQPEIIGDDIPLSHREWQNPAELIRFGQYEISGNVFMKEFYRYIGKLIFFHSMVIRFPSYASESLAN